MSQNSLQRRRVRAEDSQWKALIYAFQGVGKTVFAAEVNDHPALAPGLFLNIEGGLLSVAYRGDVDYVDIHNTQDLEQILWDLAASRYSPSSPWADVRTVVIDSGTEAQTMNLEEIGKAAHEKDPRKHPRNELWPEDYGESTVAMKRIFRMARDLPHHLIVTALPKVIYPRIGGTRAQQQAQASAQPTEISPWMTTKLSEAVMGYMDHVWYMWEDPTGRHLLTKSQGIYRCKTRGTMFAQRIGGVVNNPSLPDLYDLFLESETGKKPPVRAGGKVSAMETGVSLVATIPNVEEVDPRLLEQEGDELKAGTPEESVVA